MRKCNECGERKPLSSYYSKDPAQKTCRSCILTARQKERRKQAGGLKAGTRFVDGKAVSPEAQLALREKVRDLGGKFALTDVEGMLRFVNTHATPTNILQEAQDIVDGARRETYGHPAENHARTAAMWSAFLGTNISPRQVCMMNILQKVSRDANLPIHDSLVDIAGWARNAQLCSAEEYEQQPEG